MDYDEDPNYLDLDDILAHTQTVNCKFLLDIPGLEFLSSNSEYAVQGSQTLLPFWLAKALFAQSMIDIDLPKPYCAKFREVMEAEADVVDLHKAGPDYYKFGKLLMELKRESGNGLPEFVSDGQRNKYYRKEGETLEDGRLIAASLINTFHKRRHKLLEYSTNLSACDIHRDYREFETRLDNMEKRLFQLGRQQAQEISSWNSRKIEMIGNNLIATRLRKRRKK